MLKNTNMCVVDGGRENEELVFILSNRFSARWELPTLSAAGSQKVATMPFFFLYY